MGQLKVALHSDNASNSSNNWILNRQTTLNLILRQASMAMVIPPNFVTAHVDNGGFYIAMFAYQKIPINSKNKTKTEILMVYATLVKLGMVYLCFTQITHESKGQPKCSAMTAQP